MASQFIKLQRIVIKSVLKNIRKKDAELRLKAARHIKSKVSAKITAVGTSLPNTPPSSQSGELKSGIKVKGGAFTAYVGFVKPAYHMTALEFGGKSNPRRTTSGKSTGYMAPRPVLFPTMFEEADAVRQILSEERV